MKTDRATNLGDMRLSNELLILNMIRKSPCSRAQIAKATGLSRAGVTIIIDNLIQKEFVEETADRPGRRAVALRVRSDAGYVVGVHLRSHTCSVGLFDFTGEMLCHRELEYDESLGAVALLVNIGKSILNLTSEQGVSSDKVIGVGVCVGGPVDVSAGKVIRPDTRWHEVEIVKLLESLLPWKCFLENRSNARTMYEKLYGVSKGFSDFIYFKVDEAVGGAIVYNDMILSGFNRFGNEFGHMTIRYDGERCKCGNQGCLNMYASIPALLHQFRELGFDSWKELLDAAYSGEAGAMQAVRTEAEYLSAGIVSLCNIFEPQAIILAGDVSYRPSLLLALISENMNTRHILHNTYNAKLLVAEEADHINLRAGAAIVIESFYQGKITP